LDQLSLGKTKLAARKISMRHPPHANFGAYTLVSCLQRCNWPLGVVFTGSEGALITRRAPRKRDAVEFTQAPKYHKIQCINRVWCDYTWYVPAMQVPPLAHVCEPRHHKNRPPSSGVSTCARLDAIGMRQHKLTLLIFCVSHCDHLSILHDFSTTTMDVCEWKEFCFQALNKLTISSAYVQYCDHSNQRCFQPFCISAVTCACNLAQSFPPSLKRQSFYARAKLLSLRIYFSPKKNRRESGCQRR